MRPSTSGNSGGPTFNLKGEVVGVNTAIFSPSGGSVGIAFDIPASTVESVIPQLQKYGHVTRGWLGVQIQPVTKDIADSLGLKSDQGALVTEPQPDSPAAKAGLKSGDVITAVNNDGIKDARALARKIASDPPGTEVTLSIHRDGKSENVTVKIGRMQETVRLASREQKSRSSGRYDLAWNWPPRAMWRARAARAWPSSASIRAGEAASLGMAAGDVILKAGGKVCLNAA